LKFFDQNGNYGYYIRLFRFIVVDGFGMDLFVHFDDLQKTGIAK
jgi:cold shock CspA family protein